MVTEIKNKSWFARNSIWKWIIIILVILFLLFLYTNWKEENCNLTFLKTTYSDACASACSVKCSDEGFPAVSTSYFKDFSIIYSDDLYDYSVEKLCVCECGGCR